jgi:hypothetical protein
MSTSSPGFKKEKNVYGVKLLYNSGSQVVDEGYICHITNLIMHLLGPSPCNQPKQKEVVEMMYKKKANTPVYNGLSGFEGGVLDTDSCCDIMTIQTGQPELQHFEILEHALHAINTAGYSAVFPEWSVLDENAKAWRGVQHMRQNSLWDTSDYTGDGLQGEELRRILMQEYHWLLVRTMDGLFGGDYPDNPKWTLKTPAQLQAQHPIGYQLYVDTIAPLIAQVSHAQMTSLKNNLMRGGTLGACTQSPVPPHGSTNTCPGESNDPSSAPAPYIPPPVPAPTPAPTNGQPNDQQGEWQDDHNDHGNYHDDHHDDHHYDQHYGGPQDDWQDDHHDDQQDDHQGWW